MVFRRTIDQDVIYIDENEVGMHLAADLADHDLSLMADFTTSFAESLSISTASSLRNGVSTWETRAREGLKNASRELHAEVGDLRREETGCYSSQ